MNFALRAIVKRDYSYCAALSTVNVVNFSFSKRMKAMEQQLASLTGLVQHALLKGSNSSGGKETARYTKHM